MISQYSTEDSEVKVSPSFTHVVANILEDILSETESSKFDVADFQSDCVFNAKKVPLIKLEKYVTRIMTLTKCEENTMIHALILIDNLCEKNNIFLTKVNTHRILITAVVIAIKYLEDIYFSNAYYCKVGGISLSDLNNYELEFLQYLGFNAYVNLDTYEKYTSSIYKQVEELKIAVVGSEMTD